MSDDKSKGPGGIGMSFQVQRPVEDQKQRQEAGQMRPVEVRPGTAAEVHKRPAFRMLILADLGGAPMTAPAEVDKDGFSDFLAGRGVRRQLRVANHLGSAPGHIDLDLQFTDPKDWSPARIIEQVPALRQASAIRNAMKAGGTDDAAARQLDRLLSEASALDRIVSLARGSKPAPRSAPDPQRSLTSNAAPTTPQTPPGPGEGDDLDALLGMVDAPPPDAESAPAPEANGNNTAAQAVGSFISAITGSSRKSRPGATKAGVIGIEQLICDQLSEILDHPEIRALEAAWVGLRFLIGRADFRATPLRLEVLDVPMEKAAATLEAVILPPEEAGSSESPLGIIVAAYDHSSSVNDIGKLQALAEVGERIQVPVVTGLDIGFLGLGEITELANRRDPGTLLDQPQFQPWNALRDKECSRWLGAAYNPFLLRPARSLKTDRQLRFHGGDAAGPLWGSASWAVASLIVASLARTGWPTEITGVKGGMVDDLPLITVTLPGRGDTEVPIVAPLTQSGTESLSDAGIMPLCGQPNRDAAFLFFARTAHRPGRFAGDDDGSIARLFSSLPYNLLASLIAKLLWQQKPALTLGFSEQDAARNIGRYLNGIVEDSGLGAHAQTKLGQDEEGNNFVSVSVRTGRGVLGGVDINLDLPL